MTLPQDQFIDVGGVRTRFWQAGVQGSPVLLLHGIGCSVLEWQRNVVALSAAHRVYAIDLLGFGLTGKPVAETYTLERLAAFVLAALDALGVPRVHMAGNSLGGRLALQCAALQPARVASLLLVDPAGLQRRGTLLEFRLATLPLLGELFTWPSRPGLRMLWRKAFADPAPFVDDALLDAKLALARQPGAQAAFLKALRSFVDLGGFRPGPVAELQAALPRIEAPTLLLWGRDDRFVPAHHADVVRRLMPAAEVQVWDACGHAPQIECAARFNETALRFWRGVDG